MKLLRRAGIIIFAAWPFLLFAADAFPMPASGWHAQSLAQAVANMGLFAIVGVTLAIFGYKAFDRFTPGHLHKEIVEHKNVAAAIIGGAVILGVCIIVAAAMIG